ncbi:unnamed protein product [Didymodactylos carnosus]|uniref:Cytochrome b561 domain-containing protein n=1 Tax=Didymodactylos carnosus TaxID=1234261 RepID=A0A814E6Q7_9BILA|nr:unnamed protein product [Didymodactylos carnosus]CAF3738408.1 unnamed protein product [Didymodactylos carnosus]
MNSPINIPAQLMNSTISTPAPVVDFSLARAHGACMVVSWIFFGSNGILMARHFRKIRVGGREQLCGEAIWFQIHRSFMNLAAFLTLLAFLFIYTFAHGTWVSKQLYGQRAFTHSIMGIIIVVFSQIQPWMALFRCHPGTRYRTVFNFMHRFTGISALILSVPTIFLGIYFLTYHQKALIALLSLWTVWIIAIFGTFEYIYWRYKSPPPNNNVHNADGGVPMTDISGNGDDPLTAPNVSPIVPGENSPMNNKKLALYLVHFSVSLGFAIAIVVLICKP